ncbi:hypothetical protein FF1_041121 [Malus domestica]
MSTAEMEQLTSKTSNRIIPILKTLRVFLIFIHTFFLSLKLTFAYSMTTHRVVTLRSRCGDGGVGGRGGGQLQVQNIS